MKSLNEIRSAFLNFFAEHSHKVLPSGSLVPHNDPTLMFTNAGMVPFKNIFTGVEKTDLKRAATAQKCVRAGGKHNDLDNVGYTARHHTFFEMLGNFSFGDYFKEGAIEFAWELVTKTFALPKERILVTIHPSDEEAYKLWKKVAGFSDEKIIRLEENNWSMGPTGPCGPNSEIFYDHGPEIAGGPPGSPDEDGDRFIEIYNLVFMQYEQLASGEKINLPKPSIDTGMGLERMAAILQGVHNNYDIDLFKALIKASERESRNANHESLISHRIIADHLRSSSFLIADGVMPANEGRGYVLRRIMRRAMRHAHQLGCKEPLMYKLVPALIEQMGKAYPELERARNSIEETLKFEEIKFQETLGRGLKLLETESANLDKGGLLAGDIAFRLYDTFGFPFDLTADILRGQGILVDKEGFDSAMNRQRETARAAWSGSGAKATDKIWFEIRDEFGPTEFLGYDRHSANGKVIALVKDGKKIETAQAGEEITILTNQTPFYGESGGQAGDSGKITDASGLEIEILDTKKYGDLHGHIGKIIKGEIKNGAVVNLTVDNKRRDALRANHSATHILHAVLRKKLGNHVTQKGSLVSEKYLRFDISHSKPIAREELLEIEREVNAIIRQNSEVCTKLMSSEEAVKSGAMALFGEKYGDEVRVVSMGMEERSEVRDQRSDAYSTELCGGTHVTRTGDIGFFKIISEGAVAAGVRRIEALTGEAAVVYAESQEDRILNIAGKLKTSMEETENRIGSLLEEKKNLEKEIIDLRRKAALGGNANAPAANIEEIGGIKFIGKVMNDLPAQEMKPLADDLKKKIGSGVVAVISTAGGKVSLVVGVTEDLTSRFDAVELVKAGAAAVGGKGGGGRKDMAQAGGADAQKVDEALEEIKKVIRN